MLRKQLHLSSIKKLDQILVDLLKGPVDIRTVYLIDLVISEILKRSIVFATNTRAYRTQLDLLLRAQSPLLHSCDVKQLRFESSFFFCQRKKKSGHMVHSSTFTIPNLFGIWEEVAESG